MAREKKHIDIVIEDLDESRAEEVGKVYFACNPNPLGEACTVAALRHRCLGPEKDMFCRIALRRSDGKAIGYVLSIPNPSVDQSGALLTSSIVWAEIRRRIWTSPPIWRHLLRRLIQAIRAKFSSRGGRERLDVLPSSPDGRPVQTEVFAQLGVAPEARGSNVGVDLMLDMEKQALRRGARRACGLVSPHNIAAERLYASIGWRRTSANSDRYDYFLMHKDLEPQA